jgi:hypothetical protein
MAIARSVKCLLAAMSAMVLAAAAPAAPRCDRACLEGHANAYLDALKAQDPSRLSFAPNLRFTENSIALNPGEALWGTITRVGPYRLWAADPDTGQIGGYVTISENDRPHIMMLRLKVENGMISEVETLVNRTEASDATFAIEKKGVDPAWLQPLAANDQPSKEQLVAAVNRYFEGIMASSGDVVPFAPDCDRWLDGKQDTNNRNAKSTAAAPGSADADATGFRSTANFKPGTMGCRANMNTRMFAYITSIQPRGFRIVDRERGIVLGTFMFNHAGWIRQVDVPGVGKVDVPKKYQFPDSTHVAEMFKIKNGQIWRIEGIRNALPYGANTGWEPPLAPPAGLPGAVWTREGGSIRR